MAEGDETAGAAPPGRFLRSAIVTLRTMLIAAAGALAFYPLGLPVPWISGSMLAVGAVALFGIRVEILAPLREAVFFLLGLSIGATLTPAAVEGFAVWPASLLLLALAVPVVTIGASVVLIRLRRWPRDDALLATAPGGLSLIITIATTIGADVPRVAVVQTVRLAILVVLLPPLISTMSETGAAPVVAGVAAFDAAEFVLLVGASLAGAVLARLVRLPTPTLLGAMFASAGLHVTGIVVAPIPAAVLIPGLVVLGAFIGARFQGFTFRKFLDSLLDGLIAFSLAFAISAALAVFVAALLDLPIGQTMLAFAPGGFEVMTVLAFALGLDAAYVALHQTVRFFVISFAAPFLFRKGRGRGG